jgi:hypothetical protein
MAQSDEQQVDAPRTVNEILKTNHGEATKKIAGET